MKTQTSFALALPVGLALSACAASKPPVAQSPTASPVASTPEAPAQAPTASTVEVAPDILKACGLSAADAYFAFDSSRVQKQDVPSLNAIAACFETGALHGHTMKLVGRADPRGASEYNFTLGQSRADAVAAYVARRGLAESRLQSTSRGALDARGTDEASWVRDRRVDIELGD